MRDSVGPKFDSRSANFRPADGAGDRFTRTGNLDAHNSARFGDAIVTNRHPGHRQVVHRGRNRIPPRNPRRNKHGFDTDPFRHAPFAAVGAYSSQEPFHFARNVSASRPISGAPPRTSLLAPPT